MQQDELIGRNVALYRGDKSQKAVADAMRARGWKWSQATVWSIEKGERPLRLAEADDLGRILDVQPYRFMSSEPDARLLTAVDKLDVAGKAVADAVYSFMAARNNLDYERETISAGPESQLVGKYAGYRADELAELVVDDVVQKGIAEWERVTNPDW